MLSLPVIAVLVNLAWTAQAAKTPAAASTTPQQQAAATQSSIEKPNLYPAWPAPPRFLENWPPEAPIPIGYHRTSRAHRREVTGGLIMFGIAYTISAFVASVAVESAPESQNLWVPIAGPFLQIQHSRQATFTLLLDGLAQGLGMGMAVHGIVDRQPLLERDRGWP